MKHGAPNSVVIWCSEITKEGNLQKQPWLKDKISSAEMLCGHGPERWPGMTESIQLTCNIHTTQIFLLSEGIGITSGSLTGTFGLSQVITCKEKHSRKHNAKKLTQEDVSYIN